jgi:hypothetical protein
MTGMKLQIAILTLSAGALTLVVAGAVCAFALVYDGMSLRKYSDPVFERYQIGPRSLRSVRPRGAEQLTQDMGRLPTATEILTRTVYFGLPAASVVAAIMLSLCLIARFAHGPRIVVSTNQTGDFLRSRL